MLTFVEVGLISCLALTDGLHATLLMEVPPPASGVCRLCLLLSVYLTSNIEMPILVFFCCASCKNIMNERLSSTSPQRNNLKSVWYIVNVSCLYLTCS